MIDTNSDRCKLHKKLEEVKEYLDPLYLTKSIYNHTLEDTAIKEEKDRCRQSLNELLPEIEKFENIKKQIIKHLITMQKDRNQKKHKQQQKFEEKSRILFGLSDVKLNNKI